MGENIFRSIEEKLREIEKDQSLEDYALALTNLNEEHKMRMEELYSSFAPQMEEVYRDFKVFELPDLVDAEKFIGKVHGEFD